MRYVKTELSYDAHFFHIARLQQKQQIDAVISSGLLTAWFLTQIFHWSLVNRSVGREIFSLIAWGISKILVSEGLKVLWLQQISWSWILSSCKMWQAEIFLRFPRKIKSLCC